MKVDHRDPTSRIPTELHPSVFISACGTNYVILENGYHSRLKLSRDLKLIVFVIKIYTDYIGLGFLIHAHKVLAHVVLY